ncbi:NAD-dependent epimerase/dehydratase family protein [Subtercola sp. YIM 133946]|uniref:NAD-dependent epimerase/dehydratase family protein n=1 Tax=Subtercola sp. YIM 133946 TaxID=3118909 RepID=UPI002F91ED30
MNTARSSHGDALVGHTGFVGSNLAAQHPFAGLFNSANVAKIEGREFDTVVFSAARAEKWRINQDPQTDRVHIESLKNTLRSFRANQLVLISTVDVYASPVGVDESTPVPAPGLHAYGLHRAELERFAADHFESVLVVRLPALFGAGIKKNVIFDLLHDNNTDKIDHRGTFQYYNLGRLWADIETARAAGLRLVNFATEPVSTGVVAREAFGFEFDNEPPGSVAGSYDFRSLYADEFGGQNGYLYSADEVLAELRSFVSSQRATV